MSLSPLPRPHLLGMFSLVVATALTGPAPAQDAGTAGGLFTITVTRAELQERIAPKFPVTVQRSVARVTLENPRVLLPESGDRIGLEVDAKVALPLREPLAGRAAITGTPRYDGETKTFFLRDATIDRLDIAGLGPELSELVRKAAQAVAASTLASVALYRLDHDPNERLAAAVLKGVVVKDGAVHLSLGLP